MVSLISFSSDLLFFFNYRIKIVTQNLLEKKVSNSWIYSHTWKPLVFHCSPNIYIYIYIYLYSHLLIRTFSLAWYIEYSIVYKCSVCDHFGYTVDDLREHFIIHLPPIPQKRPSDTDIGTNKNVWSWAIWQQYACMLICPFFYFYFYFWFIGQDIHYLLLLAIQAIPIRRSIAIPKDHTYL